MASSKSKAARDNRANQLNPNNPSYWAARGEPKPPSNGVPDTPNDQGATSSGKKKKG